MRAARGALAWIALAALAGCAKPPPDLDGEPGGAVALPLGETHADTLACKQGDCADWYRIEVPGAGELSVDVAGEPSGAGLETSLLDAKGAPLAQAGGGSGTARHLHSSVTRGAFLVRVEAADRDAKLAYSISAKFTSAAPPPPPRAPEPRFETLRSPVLEVEGRPGAESFVLLDAGEGARVRVGMRGKLVDGGKTLGSIVIQNVYPDGSRARVEGPLAGTISPHTVAEIEVPVAPAGAESAPAP